MRNSKVRIKDLSSIINKLQHSRIESLWVVTLKIETSGFNNFKVSTKMAGMILPGQQQNREKHQRTDIIVFEYGVNYWKL